MSKFLRTMESLSKRPSDFQKPPLPGNLVSINDQATKEALNRSGDEASGNIKTGTVPLFNTVPVSGTVPLSDPLTLFGSALAEAQAANFENPSRVRVFRATRAEHGHSSGEHIIYEVLWRNSTGDQLARQIQIGYDKLAA